jgi:hypothetical protein
MPMFCRYFGSFFGVMRESGVRREDYGKYVDSIAAAIILQDYLNAHERKDSGDN